MRGMAHRATLDLRFVLVDKGSLFIRMAFVANLVIAVSAAELACQKASMRVVAVAALEQSFVDAMMKWPGELGPDIQMAAIAEIWSSFLQQELLLFGVVRVVAIGATYAALQVSRTSIVVVLLAVLVAIEAARADLRGGRILKCEDLRFIATAVHMSLAGPVTRFATLPFGSRVSIELSGHGGHKMRSVFEAFGDFVMAGFACIGPDV